MTQSRNLRQRLSREGFERVQQAALRAIARAGERGGTVADLRLVLVQRDDRRINSMLYSLARKGLVCRLLPVSTGYRREPQRYGLTPLGQSTLAAYAEARGDQ